MATENPRKRPRLHENDDDGAEKEQQEQAGPATPEHDGINLAKHWNVSEEDLTRAHQLWQEAIEYGIFASDTAPNVQEAALFLYAKGVATSFADDNLLCLQSVSPPDQAAKKKREAIKERLLHLLKADGDRSLEGSQEEFQDAPQKPKLQTFTDFCEHIPEWNDASKSFVFFLHHEHARKYDKVRVQRAQVSGSCFLHAPIVMQHYLVAMNRGLNNSQDDVNMVDLTKYVRQKFSADMLKKYIIDDEGGMSVEMLQALLQVGSNLLPIPLPLLPDNELFQRVDNVLKTCGPILISSFKVVDGFTNKALHQHLHSPNASVKVLGSHAMLLIGTRQDTVEPTARYLLQNWWHEKQFVEVSREYLKHCQATLTYVETPQPSIPHDLPITHALLAEAHDAAERFFERF